MIGFDDAPLAARTVPALTSMAVPWKAMAREAVARITANTDAPALPAIFEAELIIRDSVEPIEG